MASKLYPFFYCLLNSYNLRITLAHAISVFVEAKTGNWLGSSSAIIVYIASKHMRRVSVKSQGKFHLLLHWQWMRNISKNIRSRRDMSSKDTTWENVWTHSYQHRKNRLLFSAAVFFELLRNVKAVLFHESQYVFRIVVRLVTQFEWITYYRKMKHCHHIMMITRIKFLKRMNK